MFSLETVITSRDYKNPVNQVILRKEINLLFPFKESYFQLRLTELLLLGQGAFCILQGFKSSI